MRRLVYDVINADGRYFTTFSYKVAHEEGSRIHKTYLVPYSMESTPDEEKRLAMIEKRKAARKARKERGK